MDRASLVARNTAIAAISSAVENVRPLGVRALIAASIGWNSGSVRTPSFMGVAVFPGATAFTLMPCAASSQASARVIDMMPALVAQYIAKVPIPMKPATEAMLTILPACWLFIVGTTASIIMNAPLRLI